MADTDKAHTYMYVHCVHLPTQKGPSHECLMYLNCWKNSFLYWQIKCIVKIKHSHLGQRLLGKNTHMVVFSLVLYKYFQLGSTAQRNVLICYRISLF